MAWRIEGERMDDGRAAVVYVMDATSRTQIIKAAARHGVRANKITFVPDAEVPQGALRIRASNRFRVEGSRASLEAIANSGLVQRPIRTLASAMLIAWLVTMLVALLIAGLFSGG